MEQSERSFEPTSKFLTWFPDLKKEIWILSAGQLLLFIGQGFTLVYASIYFVNELGFSTTQVGLALSSAGISGTVGRFWAGNALESPLIGRRGTLLLAACISSIACFCLAFATTFAVLIVGNLLLGLGISLYWPATLAITTDLTSTEHRAEAFALTRLADNLGLGLGAFLAGQYVAMSGNYHVLFISKGIAYLLFGLVIYGAIAETLTPQSTSHHGLKNWQYALGDRTFVLYLIANLFFTTYAAQLSSTLPLYLTNFVPAGNTLTGFSEQFISYFFVGHVFLKIIFQLPVTRQVKRINHVIVLLAALFCWAASFSLVWATGVLFAGAMGTAIAAFAVISVAEILYAPAATSLVSEIAPANLRGIYFALESECWAIGFLIGPALGGWALDHGQAAGTQFWLLLIVSTGLAGTLLLSIKNRVSQLMYAHEPLTVGEPPF